MDLLLEIPARFRSREINKSYKKADIQSLVKVNIIHVKGIINSVSDRNLPEFIRKLPVSTIKVMSGVLCLMNRSWAAVSEKFPAQPLIADNTLRAINDYVDEAENELSAIKAVREALCKAAICIETVDGIGISLSSQ